MSFTTPTPNGVNSKNENSTARASDSFAWGAREIGKIIGRTERQAHYLLENGQLESAKKKGGRWVANRAALLRELGA